MERRTVADTGQGPEASGSAPSGGRDRTARGAVHRREWSGKQEVHAKQTPLELLAGVCGEAPEGRQRLWLWSGRGRRCVSHSLSAVPQGWLGDSRSAATARATASTDAARMLKTHGIRHAREALQNHRL